MRACVLCLVCVCECVGGGGGGGEAVVEGAGEAGVENNII